MKASLVSLPMADYCMPPLGISSIKGYLKEHGIINVKCYDLNLEFFYYAVNTKQLRRSIQYDKIVCKS